MARKSVIAKDVLFQPLGDEAVLLQLPTERYFGLNDVGARVWQLLEEGQTLSGCSRQIAAEYDAAEEVVRQDILNLIEQLAERRLIEVDNEWREE